MSPWEFLTYWECLSLPTPSKPPKSTDLSLYVDHDCEEVIVPNVRLESEGLLFYTLTPGMVQLQDKWYMRRRNRPMVPAPSNSPMPDKQKDADAKARIYCVYMRPWTLDRAIASVEVPHIADLDRVPIPIEASSNHLFGENLVSATQHSRKRLRRKTPSLEFEGERSFANAWSRYIRGLVVSENAARLITQFMAASCGRSKGEEDIEEHADKDCSLEMADNALPLERVHAILDKMSQAKAVVQKLRPKSTTKTNLEEDSDEEAHARALAQSTSVNDSMQLTAKLWSRTEVTWQADGIDISMGDKWSGKTQRAARARSSRKRTKADDPRRLQTCAYLNWRETSIQDWVAHLQQEKPCPNEDQMCFLLRIIDRCRQESIALKNSGGKKPSDRPLRDCLLGLPGSGKSTCIKLMRRFFEECLK